MHWKFIANAKLIFGWPFENYRICRIKYTECIEFSSSAVSSSNLVCQIFYFLAMRDEHVGVCVCASVLLHTRYFVIVYFTTCMIMLRSTNKNKKRKRKIYSSETLLGE